MVAPPLPPILPSRHFCQTGILALGERYNQEIHNMGTNPRERCSRFYPEYAGGRKKRTHRKERKYKHVNSKKRKSKNNKYSKRKHN